MTSRLEIRHLSKTFGQVPVLRDVNIAIKPGEIHGLIGQNGSGKSTVIRILSGFYQPDDGCQILIDGRQLDMPVKPRNLQSMGLAFVHQNLGLENSASVIENVRIGRFSRNQITRQIDWDKEAEGVHEALKRLGQGHINPYSMVGSLNHVERASVAIARALQGIQSGHGCIVFDESTQSLPRDVLKDFYAQVRRIAAEGTSIIIVSHRLEEVLEICDSVTVLEDGKVTVASAPTAGMTEAELTRLILGQSSYRGISVFEKSKRDNAATEPLLLATGLSGGHLNGVDVELYPGEVVGIIGDPDSGSDELPYLISGTTSHAQGSIKIGNRTINLSNATPAKINKLGIAFVPSKRTSEGLAVGMPATENISLPRLRKKGRPWFLGRNWQDQEFRQSVESLGVTPAFGDLQIQSFSGGNQQKLLLAKWMFNEPTVLVLHEPTQAVDVGARDDILRALRKMADEGSAVLISSIETDDLSRICDRVLIMKDGLISNSLEAPEISSHQIIDAVYDRND